MLKFVTARIGMITDYGVAAGALWRVQVTPESSLLKRSKPAR
jgi:hypothetical protein